MSRGCQKELFDIAKKAFGDDVSEEEVQNYLRSFQRRSKLLQKTRNMTVEESYRETAAQLLEQRKLKVEDYHNQSMRSVLHVADFKARVAADPDKPWADALADQVRTIGPAQAQRIGELVNGLGSELEEAGDDVLKAAQSAQEAVGINEMLQNRSFSDSPAGNAARIIDKYQRETIPQAARELGLSFHELEGWSHTQVHDNNKIFRLKLPEYLQLLKKGTVGEDERNNFMMNRWVNYLMPRLDWGLSFPEAAVDEKGNIDEAAVRKELEQDWWERRDRSYGNYSKDIEGDMVKKANFANRLTGRERTYHFKDSASDIEYQKEYGAGGLWEAIQSGLVRTAKTFAIADKFGPMPELAYSQIKKMIMDDPEQARKSKTAKSLQAADYGIKNALGHYGGPATSTIAKAAINITQFNNLARLGNLLMKVTGQDLASVHAIERTLGGATRAESFKTQGRIIKNLLTKTNEDTKELNKSLGVFTNTVIARTMNRMNVLPDQTEGALSYLNTLMFKWNMVHRWDSTAVQAGVAQSFANRLAQKRNMEFESLPTDLQKHMQVYQVGKAEWNILRKQSARLADNNSYLTGDSMENATKEQVLDYLKEKNLRKDTDTVDSITDDEDTFWRKQIGTNVTQMTGDYGHFIITHPDFLDKSRTAAALENTSGFSWAIQHLVMQYKSYGIAYTKKVLGSVIRSQQSKTAIAEHLLALGALSVIYNYASRTLIGGIEGKGPPTLNVFSDNKKERDEAEANMAEYLVPAGGMWLDNLYQFWQQPVRASASFLGPTVSTAADAVSYIKNLAKNSDLPWYKRRRKNNLYMSAKLATGNLPFHNLPPVLAAWNILIRHSMMNMIAPEVLHKQIHDAQQSNNEVPFTDQGE